MEEMNGVGNQTAGSGPVANIQRTKHIFASISQAIITKYRS
jgi:hypothetical protein